jgi:tetratricopeptide (TPR) repeat protein
MNRDYDAALAAGREAIANRPTCANANGFYANVLHYCGEDDEAIRHINLAMRYQPLHPPLFKNILSAAYLAKNELASAISTAKQTIELAPADILARLILVAAYVKSDRQDLAKEIVAEIKNLDPSFSVARFADTQYYRNAEFIEEFTAELRSAGLPD